MKKFSLLLLILLLASCSSPPTRSPSTPSPAPQTSQTPKPVLPANTTTPIPFPTLTPHSDLQVPLEELNGMRLLFWHPWTGELAEAVNAIVRDFNQSNVWGVQVFTDPAGGSGALANRLESNLIEGPLPHLLVAPSEQILLWQAELALFADLNPYLQDANLGLTREERSSIPDLYWSQDAADGVQVGLPALRDMRVIFYNQSWGRDLGFFTPPQSFVGFQERACEAAEQRVDIDQTGGWIIDTHPETTLSWLLTANPPQIYDPQVDMYQFDSRAASSVLADLRSLFDAGCAWNSRLPDPYQYFADRQALVYTGSLADIPIQSEWMQRRQNPDEWTVLPFPVEDGKPVTLVSGSAYAVLKATPAEQLASWLFLRWLILPRHQALLTRSSGLLPVSASTAVLLEDYQQAYPQWKAVQGLVPLSQPVPQGGSWTIVQTILEDAAWQTFQPFMEPEEIPLILEQVDQLIPEVLSMREK